MLLYYKTGVADLKFSEKEDTLLYKMKKPEDEAQNIVDELIKSISKPSSGATKERTSITTEDADGTPDA